MKQTLNLVKKASELPKNGKPGDLCLLNNILMHWESTLNTFISVGELKFQTKPGPTGSQGETGPTGPTGATGTGVRGLQHSTEILFMKEKIA